ncbi:MAG: hypothetical protein JSV18_00940 [Candidatus Bathyarchaeota archaeon]|nr:MAG: hypothetical protein JSV18_00940 [Candidatus Bathyarchaeota archaeon]
MTLEELLWRFSEEPIIPLLIVATLANLILITRVLLRRRGSRDVVQPREIIVENEARQLHEEKGVKPEISPIPIVEEVESLISLPLKDRDVGLEIRPLLVIEKPDQCAYCAIFKDLSTVVCPNCGRPLNIKPASVENSH